MRKGDSLHAVRWIWGIIVLFVVTLLLSRIGNSASAAQTEQLNCNTTATSVGLDIVLPIQAGEEEFKTGAWVYHTPGSDHSTDYPKDYCALDFLEVEGKHVVAVADGKVQEAKWDNPDDHSDDYGYYVVVVHDDVGFEEDGKKYFYYSLYAHLQDPDSEGFPSECKVSKGKTVKTGDCIGVSGDSGRGGAHLHFTMYSGTGPFANVSPVAPENSIGIKLYKTLEAKTSITPMATAETDDANSPSLSIKLNETQNKTFTFINTSKIEWNSTNKFELVKISGNAVGAPERVSLKSVVKPQETASFTIPIQGTSPNLYESQWRLHHNNIAFGPVVTLRYEVGINTDDIGSAGPLLWDILEPIVERLVWDYILGPVIQIIWNEFLRQLYSLCGLTPLALAGIFFATVHAGRWRQNRGSWKFEWGGRGSWWTVIFSAIGLGITFLFSALLLISARELVWWSGIIRNTSLILLGLGGLILLWGLTRLGKWIRDLGFKRAVIILLLILLPATYFHGQRYRSDEAPVPRYVYSVGDLVLLGKYHVQDYWAVTKEFASEVIDALGER